ncbi:MAG: hypothetical protein JSV82_02600 [Planctomycetota bacterium]|nr:MAG: hypothetical protein JSV82_02600 [Planctomycetota bacterium]
MKRPTHKALVLAVGIVLLIIAGCEQENLLAIRKSRLIAIENEKLKEQLVQCENEIEQQKELFEKELEQQKENLEEEIERQKSRLDECQERKRALEKKTKEILQEQIDSVFMGVMEENVKLRRENEDLKAQIKQLSEEAGEGE